MATKRVTVTEADGHLAELIEAVKRGEEVVIEDHEQQTQLKLVTRLRARKPRVLGLHKGMVEIGKDFDEPLPNSFWLGGQS